MVTAEKVQEVFTYHQPKAEDIPRYLEIREAGRALASVIVANTPRCADQQAALRKVREAVMTANAAIALGGLV